LQINLKNRGEKNITKTPMEPWNWLKTPLDANGIEISGYIQFAAGTRVPAVLQY
jgi:hypothetical protein